MLCSYQTIKAQTKDSVHMKITLDETVISANKKEEQKKRVAQQTQVLTGNEISATQSQTTADLLQQTGNVAVQKSQLGGGSPCIRGFEANRILLMVDGVRMNNLIYRGGHLQNIVTLDNNSLERMEVLYGPASTIYGSDALGGVISLYTKSPKLAMDKTNIHVNASTRYGSADNEMTNHLDFNYGTLKFGSLTSVTYSNFGDLRGGENQNPFYTTSYGERPYYAERINGKDSLVKNADKYLQVGTAYSQYDVLQKFLFQQNGHVSHGINLQYSNSSDVPRYDRLTDTKGTGLNSAEWYYGPQTRMMTAYDFNYKNADAKFQGVHFGLNYQSIEESRHSRGFGSRNLSNRIENVGVMGANLDFQKTMEKHNIHFGLDAQNNTLKSTANKLDIVANTTSPLDTRYPDGDNTMMSSALYFSHTYKINDEVTLTDGLRAGMVSLHSTFKDTTFFKFPFNEINQSNPVYSGSLGIIQNPSDDLKLSLLFSSGFRVPNVDDAAKVFESSAGTLIVPNNNLKPEQTLNSELGISKIFNGNTRWENALYYTQFRNAIVTDKFQYNGKDSILYNGVLSGVMASQNKREAYIYGFSSNVKSEMGEFFTLTLSGNYTYGRIKTDSADAPLDHIPPFLGRLLLNYENKNFNSAFYINYNGAKKLKDYYLNGEDNEKYATPMGMPEWFTANIHATLKVHKYITLQAGVQNILDTQYRTFASGINGAGRNIFASLRLHY